MKKKLILLPLLMLALGACGSSVAPSSSSVPPSSSGPVADTNVYRIVGNVQDNEWTPDDDEFIMVKDADENIFTYEGIDMFVGEEWCITINGAYDGQIGFTGTSNLTLVDTGVTMELGGGPGTVKNFKVKTEGNYDVELNTGVTPRVLTITRVGDAVEQPPAPEVDAAEWHLIGTMNSWTEGDKTFPLYFNLLTEMYTGEFDLVLPTEGPIQFKIATGSTWDNSRGNGNVEVPSPAPAWLDLTDGGGNIKITEAGKYLVEFNWIATAGGVVGGEIFINKVTAEMIPAGFDITTTYSSIAAIKTEATLNKEYGTRGVITGLNGGLIYMQDTAGGFINAYVGGTATATLVLGNVIDVLGLFKLTNEVPQLSGEGSSGVATMKLVYAKSLALAPVVIDEAATLTTRTGTDYALSGQLVRINGVTAGTFASNAYDLNLGASKVQGYTGFSAGHEATSTNRAAIEAKIIALNTSGATFDIIGVLVHYNNTAGSWRFFITSVDQIIETPAA